MLQHYPSPITAIVMAKYLVSTIAVIEKGQCTVGDAFTVHGVIGKNSCCLKIFVSPLVFKLQKWFLLQNGVEFNHKSKLDVCVHCVDSSRMGAGRPKNSENMLI